MFSEKFLEVISQEGVVSVVSWSNGDAHVSNTWNSYLVATEDERLLIPANGFRKTQGNIEVNPQVKLTLGAREVMGYRSMGTGFLIEGTARFVKEGAEYDMMKEKFPFINRVLEIKVESAKQTL